jgi:hypothetical protein
MQTTTMEFAQMSKNEFSNGDFIACVPHQIETEWHETWGPLLAGFPVNIVYAQTAESDQNKIIGVTACYEPDLATFRETKKTRTMTYRNSEGSTYRVRVVLNKANGRLDTFKYKGEKLVARASGLNFESAMVQTTLVGIYKDEPVKVIHC